jgi:ribosomal protein S18 acetylase RimI-like enzyme
MTPECEIRRAGPGEVERLVALVRRFHGESGHDVGPAQADAVAALYGDPALGAAWILRAEGHDAGYALACYRHSIDHGGRVAFLDDLWLEPAVRGRGWGKRLLAAACDGLSAGGARAVFLEADPGDAAAIGLYAGSGFAATGTALYAKSLPAGGQAAPRGPRSLRQY